MTAKIVSEVDHLEHILIVNIGALVSTLNLVAGSSSNAPKYRLINTDYYDITPKKEHQE